MGPWTSASASSRSACAISPVRGRSTRRSAGRPAPSRRRRRLLPDRRPDRRPLGPRTARRGQRRRGRRRLGRGHAGVQRRQPGRSRRGHGRGGSGRRDDRPTGGGDLLGRLLGRLPRSGRAPVGGRPQPVLVAGRRRRRSAASLGDRPSRPAANAAAKNHGSPRPAPHVRERQAGARRLPAGDVDRLHVQSVGGSSPRAKRHAVRRGTACSTARGVMREAVMALARDRRARPAARARVGRRVPPSRWPPPRRRGRHGRKPSRSRRCLGRRARPRPRSPRRVPRRAPRRASPPARRRR